MHFSVHGVFYYDVFYCDIFYSWEWRMNRELEELSKGENIVKWIKGQRIIWLGHLERCVGLTTLPPSCADCLEI
jgi:hypothetical protein